MALSPMMQQYLQIKEQYPDTILFFRLGDFYEMFFDDAKLVAQELDLTLTGKECGLSERAPMCGVPYHAVETYLQRLIEKGYKVAICEQMTDPALTKGLVERKVIRVVTPGCAMYRPASSACIRFQMRAPRWPTNWRALRRARSSSTIWRRFSAYFPSAVA